MNSQIAWAAGLFESKARIKVRKDGKPVLSMYCNQDRDVLSRFIDIVGYGEVLFRDRHGATDRKDAYYWEIYARNEVRRILDMFLPFLGDRNAHAALNVLDYLECT